MKEITPEIRERIFALYWGGWAIGPGYNFIIGPFGFMKDMAKSQHALSVRPLADITDEEAIEVCKIMDFIIGSGLRFDRNDKRIAVYSAYNDEPLKKVTLFIYNELEIFSLDEYGKVFQYDAVRIITACDYLRSRGFALPAFGFTVDQLVEAGVFKIKTNDHGKE